VNLCDTCRLFGSPFTAAHISVNDLYVPTGEWNNIIQVRDGVAIDRDSEKAKDRLKYDFEVVPASVSFDLEMVLENATPKDLQLLCVGLSEYVHGFGVVGGKRSRGLGVGILNDLRVHALELEDKDASVNKQRLRNYLVKGAFSAEVSGAEFLETHIGKIFV
jgi:CRISPR/Cas system CSM-associated protein Csm3 (group 7 of RAMP superfamily)